MSTGPVATPGGLPQPLSPFGLPLDIGAELLEYALFQQLFDEAPLGIAVFRGLNYVIEMANPAVCALWGRTQAQALHTPLFELLPEAAGQGFEQLLDQVMATGVPYVAHELPSFIDRHGRRDTVYWNFVYYPLRGDDGSIDGVTIVATEVSEQVQNRQRTQILNEELVEVNARLQDSYAQVQEIQRQLTQANDELEIRVEARTGAARAARLIAEQQRTRLIRLFQQAPAAVCMVSGPQYVFELVNPGYQQLFPDRQLLGRPVLEALPELVGQAIPAILDAVYRTGTSHHGREVLIRLAGPNGGAIEDRYFDFVYQARYDEAGRIDGIVVFGFEVTAQVLNRQREQELGEEMAIVNEELRINIEELSTANSRLSTTNAELDTFVYTASHDLKAPIANIEGLLAALREELPAEVLTQPTTHRLLALMDDSVARFLQTIGHLTDITRLEDAAAQPAEALSLRAEVESVRLDLAPALEAAGARLHVDLDACPVLSFAPKTLRSILYNLLSNAIKYRDPQRPPVITLRASRSPGQVHLEVQDNGLGLTKDQQGQLFQLFCRLHAHVEGSGVGLYMVKKIVENAGGGISVASTPGVGSTFRVSLPG